MFQMHGFDRIQVSNSILIFKSRQTSLEGIQDPQALWLGEEGALPLLLQPSDERRHRDEHHGCHCATWDSPD